MRIAAALCALPAGCWAACDGTPSAPFVWNCDGACHVNPPGAPGAPYYYKFRCDAAATQCTSLAYDKSDSVCAGAGSPSTVALGQCLSQGDGSTLYITYNASLQTAHGVRYTTSCAGGLDSYHTYAATGVCSQLDAQTWYTATCSATTAQVTYWNETESPGAGSCSGASHTATVPLDKCVNATTYACMNTPPTLVEWKFQGVAATCSGDARSTQHFPNGTCTAIPGAPQPGYVFTCNAQGTEVNTCTYATSTCTGEGTCGNVQAGLCQMTPGQPYAYEFFCAGGEVQETVWG